MKYITLILLFLATSISATAQRVDSMMNVYTQQFPQQKAYVHFDKEVYRAGESIWFKAYVFAGFSPAINSKNFYAELIDSKGNIVQRKVYPLSESTTAGSFDIPENSGATNLRFRGYTTWMLNFDTSFLFTKSITIVNKNGAVSKQILPPGEVSLRFFPEGGELVNELESVVAFKANDSYGIPVKVNGVVQNSKGEVVAKLDTQHDGMGTFKFIPQANETYVAAYNDETKVERTAQLPLAKSQGVTMQILTADDKAVFIVKRSLDVPPNLKSVYIVAHIAQQMVYKAKVPLDNNAVNSGSFSIAKHPSGILQFTLFNSDWQPVAERILMIQNNDYLINTKVEALEVNQNKRAKNVFEIQLEDTSLANLSIAITDAEINAKPYGDNIISRMLLTGDLKGYVHNPAYYFSGKSAAKHLDLVMLTNGWRRYNWQDVVQHKTPQIKFPDTSYINLNAKVFGLGGSTTLRSDESLTAIIQAKDSGMQVLELPRTGADIFSLQNLVFFDTVQVHYQFNKNRKLERKLTIKLSNGLFDGYKKINIAALPLVSLAASDSALQRTALLSDQIIKFGSSWGENGNVLETVTVKTKVRTAIEELDKRYTSGLFTSNNAYTFDMVNNKSYYTDVFQFLQSRIPGLQINRSGGEVFIQWRQSETVVFLDEMQMEPSFLTTVSVGDIAYVKVFRPPFFGAFGGGSGGAIAIYTRKGGDEARIPTKTLAFDKLAGYSAYKEFYSPDYSTRSGSGEVVADYRSTLYWNPYILTDATKQKVKIEFFNNDITKAFRVVLEGINEEGKLVRVEKIIQ